MHDLYLAFAILAAAALTVFWLSTACLAKLSILGRACFALGVMVVMSLYACFLWHSLILAQWLPFSSLIVLGNWFPVFLAALAACVWSNTRASATRRSLFLTILTIAGGFAAAYPLLGEAPTCRDQFSYEGHCSQSTQFTCSAASAATLLRLHNIPATEQEMAELCLTRKGTSWLGLYRGLKLKTAGTEWDVEIVQYTPGQWRQMGKEPMIIEVGLDRHTHVDATFRDEFGWEPGRKHCVILNGLDSTSRAKIIDPMPAIGEELWDGATLQMLWHGCGMRLIQRD